MVITDRKRGELTFVCNFHPGAKKAFVAGDFNEWDPARNRMVKARDGSFRARVKLPPGKYEYKFFIDGDWVEDPDTEKVENSFGTANSVVQVS